jgi:hypothetical protein
MGFGIYGIKSENLESKNLKFEIWKILKNK